MMQGLQKFPTTLIENSHRTIVAAANYPVTLHCRSNLKQNIGANGIAERLYQRGRQARRYSHDCNAIDNVGNQKRPLILRKCFKSTKNYMSPSMHKNIAVTMHVLVGISVTHFSRNGSTSYAIL